MSPTSWLTARTIFAQVFALLLFGIQAPLLGPKAFGLVSIVMIFVGFCEAVPGEAAADSLISIRDIEDGHFATMMTANLAVSLAFGAAVFLGAKGIARFFGAPELAPILHWMAVLPAITAFSVAPTAATKRNMQFAPLALRSMGSTFIGGLVGLVLTLTGFGVWALVWQAIVTRVVSAIVLWLAVPIKLRFGFSRRHFGDLVQYAAPTIVSRIMSWLSSQIARFILGFYWGPTPLGLFSLAGRLSDMFMELAVIPRYSVARVELRRFASDAQGLQAALHRILTLMSVFCFPFCVGGAVVAPTLFHVWLDPRWYDGIIPSQFLLLTSMALITHYCAGAALLAMNKQTPEAVASFAQTLSTVLVVAVSAPFGITLASAAIAARPYAMLPLPLILLERHCGVSPRGVLLAQRPALVAALTMGCVVWLLQLEAGSVMSYSATLPLLIVAGIAVYGAMIAVLLPGVAAEFAGRFNLSPITRYLNK